MYAYPQRPGAGGQTPLTAFGQPQQQQPTYVPTPPPVAAPMIGLTNAASGSITILRLKIAEHIRIEPPVAVSATLLSASGPQALTCPDLTLERQLVEKEGQKGAGPADKASSGSSSDVDAYLATLKAGEVPQDPAIMQLVAKGLSPQAAALGVVYARAGRGGAEKATEFASGVEQLTTMGFTLPLAAGALAKHKGNVEAATESCLAIAS
ncbi:hypothetical protein VaNZ11_010600 [Volvox africanus]|uniref:UBA domain-containing protein n=1 Tax=Volvox africanus TaxID=51714 RepID=A0ABQ5S9W9_9CHLO|nr:hypothetical protein VaNZ11_010600 [Volvox africanus]